MNHNSLYNSWSLAPCNEWSRCSLTEFMYAHVYLYLWCLYISMTIKVYQPEITNTWLWAGWSLWTGFLWPTKYSCFVVSFSWNWFPKVAHRKTLYTDTNLWPLWKNIKRYPTWSPQSHVNRHVVLGFWYFAPSFPSTLSLTYIFSLSPTDIWNYNFSYHIPTNVRL